MRIFNLVVVTLMLIGLTATANAYTALRQSITQNGMNQGDLVLLLENLRDAVNEMITDHATNRTSLLEIETLIEELAADHATNKTFTDELKTDLNALKTDLGTIATKMDSDAGITDTNYAAQIAGTTVSSSGAATLTAATSITAPAATLTNSTAISLTP